MADSNDLLREMQSEMRILGIETSCDETGVAIYDSNQGLRAHSLYSQVPIHAAYGGVVPELASRDHVRKVIPLIDEVFKKANMCPAELDGIAYTAGPGLAGALLVGACIGKSLGFAWGIPTIGVHHLEGHLLAPMLEATIPTFPFLALLVSGGHTQLVSVKKWGSYDILGESVDDAAGEAFDKTAKILGLGYPGGAALANLAEQGNPHHFRFPRPMLDRPGLDFSFSGLKTFAANTLQTQAKDDQTKADIARAFEEAVVETLTVKCRRALRQTGLKSLVVAGGVGANKALRQSLQTMVAAENADVFFPRHEFCTDNGAMIAYAGCLRLWQAVDEDVSIKIYPRWDISTLNPSDAVL